MAKLVDRLGPPELRPESDPERYFARLVRAIVAQQLSARAARTILDRVQARLPDGLITPSGLASVGPEALRACGLSGPKTRYVLALADGVASGEIDLAALAHLADDEVAARLTAIKGIGTWTAEMFLIFALGRPDIMPLADAGVRAAIRHAYRLDAPPTSDEMARLAEPWRPYRSFGAWYLWRSLDAPLPQATGS